MPDGQFTKPLGRRQLLWPLVLPHLRMLPACLRKIVPVPSASGLGSRARDPGRSRWSPPEQPAGGVASASWSSLARSVAISFRASTAIGDPKASWGDAVGPTKRRRRAARRRQSRTRRCKVRSWPGRNTPGCSRGRRSKSSFAVRCGSVSSHWTIRGQLVSNGSCRVRQCRGGLWRARWVGRTSPARHASARLRRNPSRSASRSGIGWTVAPAARAAR